MPSKLKFVVGMLCVLTLALAAYPQTVYVSGGPNIYAVTITSTGTTTTTIVSNASANFESLAIGPDNVDTDDAIITGVGNAKYSHLLYACDTAGNTVSRFAFLPGAPTTSVGPKVVYSGTTAGLVPVCGRSSSKGDFYITNKSGKGLFVFSGVANAPFDTLVPSDPALVKPLKPDFPATMTGRALTQKYVGDLYVVDNAGNEVLSSPYAVPFASVSTFIGSSNLNGPVGIATAVTTTPSSSGVFLPNSRVFVANSNSVKNLPTQPPVSVFNTQTGMPAALCSGLNFPSGNNKQVADYLASTPTADSTNAVINNTIYLASNTNNSGALWSWNDAQSSCTLNPVASFGTTVSGVAVAPAPVTLNIKLPTTGSPTDPTTFNFNSSIFQLTAQGCTASVTAYPLSLATLNSMINLAQRPGGDLNASPPYPAPLIPPSLPYPALPAVNLGDWGGFETGYVAHWSSPAVTPGCTSVFSDGGFVTSVFNFVDASHFTNPRMLQCDNSDPATEPKLFPPNVTTTCGAPSPIGVYPLSGPIAADSGVRLNSFFAMVNEMQGPGTIEPGQFCGFQSPLSNKPPPGLAGSFSASTTTLNVKFKLSLLSGNCKKDFITDAVALISVAKIQNPDGTTTFSAINVRPTSSSLDQPPIFNSGNQQYSFTLNLPSIFAQAGAGIYSVTVTFLSDNTVNQTILLQLTP